ITYGHPTFQTGRKTFAVLEHYKGLLMIANSVETSGSPLSGTWFAEQRRVASRDDPIAAERLERSRDAGRRPFVIEIERMQRDAHNRLVSQQMTDRRRDGR